MSLTKEMLTYRPHKYPWALENWKQQSKTLWLADEVPMGKDVGDFNTLPEEMRSLLVNIFRMFVQSDVDVYNCYHKVYQKLFKPTEFQMMLSVFSYAETVHMHAYAHLLDTLGFPEDDYHAFLDYTQMKAKHDWMRSFDPKDATGVAETLAAVSGFGEGMHLFASFAMLLNFSVRPGAALFYSL